MSGLDHVESTMAQVPSQLRAEDTEQIYALMGDTQSNEIHVREPADTFLRSCERVPGFCSVLLSILDQRDADTSARVLSLICLRNVVRRHWSPSRRSKEADIVAEEGAWDHMSYLPTNHEHGSWGSVCSLGSLSLTQALFKRFRRPWCLPNVLPALPPPPPPPAPPPPHSHP